MNNLTPALLVIAAMGAMYLGHLWLAFGFGLLAYYLHNNE